jgi:hypothetical protein
LWRSTPGICLHRCTAGQFVIVYTYTLPGVGFPRGIVSVRSIRLLRDDLSGVEEPIAAHATSSDETFESNSAFSFFGGSWKSDAQLMAETAALAGRRSGSYDPCDPDNIEARRYDPDDGIDWEEIILSTQEDVEAGRYAFNSEDYATDEEAMAALGAWLDAIIEKAEREAAASISARDVQD